MIKVLFVCIENSCRSQMAEGLAREMGKGVIQAYSAGSRPSGKIDPTAVEVMREIGIDISRQRSKGFDELPVEKFDYVITLGCKDVCPFVPAKSHIEWKIEDPKGKGEDEFRRARDILSSKIEEFMKEIK